MPKVSVIIPTFNYAKYLDRTIQSVLDQTYKDYEVIVVDDGSTDNTKEIIKKYENRILYIYQSNKGLCAARNTGILNSKGEYISLLDADDIYMPDALEKQVNFLDSKASIDIVYCRWNYINDNNEQLPLKIKKINKEGNLFDDLLLGKISLVIHALLIPRRCFEKAGLFDESFSGDEVLDILFRFCKTGYRFSYIDNVLVSYRLHARSRGANNIDQKLRNKTAILDKIFKNGILETTIKDLKQKSYYYAFSECAWYYYQEDRNIKSIECLSAAIYVFPEVLVNPSIFKQWIYSSVPWRNRLEGVVYNRLSDIEEFIYVFLKKIFNNNSLPISIKLAMNKIYSNFYITLSECYYCGNKINKARAYLLKAIRFNPGLLISYKNVPLFIKIMLGKSFIASIIRKYYRKIAIKPI